MFFTRVVIHVLLEGLGEALGAKLADVHGKDNEVEVSEVVFQN